jgi:radical SAM protein with 4Fe4S-binding SPASM domain
VSLASFLEGKRKQAFHLKHEFYTWLAYCFPGLPPDRFVFVLTNLCNLKCRDCYQDRQFDKSRAMTKDDWIVLSDDLPAFARVTLTSGEPLLMKGFRELFEKVAARHPCNIITNGVLLSEELIDLLLAYPNFKVLGVSVDGFKDASVALRGISEREWLHLETMLKRFVARRDEKKSKCLLEIKTLILDDNADTLYDFHRYCMEELGVDHHTLQFLKGSALQHSDRMCDYQAIFEERPAYVYKRFDVIVDQLERIRKYNVSTGKAAFLHPAMGNLTSASPLGDNVLLMNKEFLDRSAFRPCRFPWTSVHVNYDGECFPCLSFSLGNVKQKRMKEILRDKPCREFLGMIRERGLVPACSRCGWIRAAQRKGDAA